MMSHLLAMIMTSVTLVSDQTPTRQVAEISPVVLDTTEARTLHPSVAMALARIITIHQDFYDRGLMKNEIADEVLYENLQYLEAVYLPVDEIAPDRYNHLDMVYMHLHRCGYQVVAAAFDEAPELRPEDFAPLFDNTLLRASPVTPCERWAQVDRAVREVKRSRAGKSTQGAVSGLGDQALAEIGNISGRFLLWGLLNYEPAWSEPGLKARWISEMLGAGASQRLVAVVVQTALQPPLAIPDNHSYPFADTITLAGRHRDKRGKVGFTEQHLSTLQAFVDGVEYTRGLNSADPFASESVTIDNSGEATRVFNDDGYLPEWATTIRDWAFEELHPEAPLRGKDASLAERESYWDRIWSGSGWSDAWQKGLAHLTEIASNKAKHPNDRRIAELEALAAAGPLDEAKREELEGLKRQRQGDHDKIRDKLLDLLVEKAPSDLALEKLRELPKLFADGQYSFREDNWLRAPIRKLARHDPQLSLRTLQENFGKDGATLSSLECSAMVGALQLRQPPGAADMLERIGREGSARERAEVLINTRTLSGERASNLFDGVLSDIVEMDAQGHNESRIRLGAGFVNGIRARINEPWALDALVSSFDRNGTCLWSSGHLELDETQRAWAIRTLASKAPEKFAQLKSRQAIPADMLKALEE
ncbi:MAG: hypothetical protein KDD53_02300 [Bdellovibrionales bacterium]|nr:hypothetical protein [Bdellovibrionales bacterium]